jgi:AcrR family transcriptional regulator
MRTRRAILSAAASVLARDRTATLADIAEAADVGRSTLHRYFADRDELVRAAIDDSFQVLTQSVTGAAIHEGPAMDALRRLVAALVDTGDRLLFLFGDTRTLEGVDLGTAQSEDHLADLVRRGQQEGVFDPEITPYWFEQVLHALVYTACLAASEGKMPRHGVTATVIRTLENGIAKGST